MTPFALSALKYGLFALLFLFVWRSMRWAVRGLTVEPSPSGRKARKSGGAVPVPTAAERRRRASARRQGAHRQDRRRA